MILSLTYTYQSFAKNGFGVDWEYHHDLQMINRTSFLLNYLSGTVNGAKSYRDWLNPDLWEQTHEQFGICRFPGEWCIPSQTGVSCI